MADVFISFATPDTARAQILVNALRERGISVFWSKEIPKSATDYHAVIKAQMLAARLVIVTWTKASVLSHPVSQECAQAERDEKLIQVLLDELEPLEFPMEARFRAQKTKLIGWWGDRRHPEWIALCEAIDARLAGALPQAPFRADDLARIFQINASLVRQLNELGVFHYRQIADWTGTDIDRMNTSLGTAGLIERDNWIDQARLLAAGGNTAYSRTYDAQQAAAHSS